MELGERLVAKREVAITELIKNAYDADSPICRVWQEAENGKIVLHIFDEGHGITLEEFKKNWMTIATGEKSKKRYSRVYRRIMTGAKGIGRFAVRFLGRKLELKSVAEDLERNLKTQLTAKFDWDEFIAGKDLREVKVPYSLKRLDSGKQKGTHLIISDLYEKWDDKVFNDVKNNVLKITSPISGLEAGPYKKEADGKDPGFDVFFSPPGKAIADDIGEAANTINYSWASLTIKMVDNSVDYNITFRDDAPGFKYNVPLDENHLEGLFADIRFFPYRKGVFGDIPNVKGRKALEWVKDNSGIAIYDHGFRMPPYGYKDDDWLNLSSDKASNRRRWRSKITEKVFPSETMVRIERFDPSLFLPANHQLVGAVFLESHQAESNKSTEMLIPAMDRQGYVENKAFRQLQDIVRAGVEFLAVTDKKDQLRREELRVEQERQKFKTTIIEARQYVESSTEMSANVKRQLIQQFGRIETQHEALDQYHIKARESIELMGTLGAVAGFMTHESQTIFDVMKKLIEKFSVFASEYRNAELLELVSQSKENLRELHGHLEYTNTFIKGIHRGEVQEFRASPQVGRIIQKFGNFAKRRGIIVENKIGPDVVTAPTLVTIYSGILLNLYTNALKAV